MAKLKRSELKGYTIKMIKANDSMCPLCERTMDIDSFVADHCHVTGVIRDAICRNCNGLEGLAAGNGRHPHSNEGVDKIQWAKNVAAYWEKHEANPRKVIYPSHLTPQEKIIANKKKRAKAAATRRARGRK